MVVVWLLWNDPRSAARERQVSKKRILLTLVSAIFEWFPWSALGGEWGVGQIIGPPALITAHAQRQIENSARIAAIVSPCDQRILL